MKPDTYLEYLQSKKWVSKDALDSQLILSFMPAGLAPEVWQNSKSEKFFLGNLRRLPGQVSLLSSFGIGAPAARTHLALAIAAGVKNIISVGTVGAVNPELKIGDLVLLNEGHLDDRILSCGEVHRVKSTTVFDIFERTPENTDVVEMESAQLFAWCQKQGVKISFLGVVSDLLAGDKWLPGFDEISDSLGRAHRLAYEALKGKL